LRIRTANDGVLCLTTESTDTALPTPEKRTDNDEDNEYKRNPATRPKKGPVLRNAAACSTEKSRVYGIEAECVLKVCIAVLGGHFHQDRMAVDVLYLPVMNAPW
jgi:hypothetical protein